jgi:hypothetical protein
MQRYNGGLARAGILLAADVRAATSNGVRVKFKGEKPTVIDGPFAETKELIAGFSMLQVTL